jgi:hypothetical protein
MKELWDKDEEVIKLIRDQGILRASPDLTGRIMQLIEEDRKPVPVYKPLLTRKTVIAIAASIALLLVIYGYVINPGHTGESYFLSTLKPLFNKIKPFHVSINLPVGSLVIATIASASIGFLLSLDIVLFKRYREA